MTPTREVLKQCTHKEQNMDSEQMEQESVLLPLEHIDHDADETEEIEPEDDGQPTEYEEWQDFYGGDDWDHGQYDNQF